MLFLQGTRDQLATARSARAAVQGARRSARRWSFSRTPIIPSTCRRGPAARIPSRRLLRARRLDRTRLVALRSSDAMQFAIPVEPPQSGHERRLFARRSGKPIGRAARRPARRRPRHAAICACEPAMFGLFERLLKPTEMPEHPEPPPGLVGFYWHFARQAKGLLIGLFVAGFVVALLDSLIPVFIGRIVTLITSSKPEELFADHWHVLARHGGGAAGAAPACAHRAEHRGQPGDRGQCRQHDPLAEPLARGAPELGVLPERLRRPHRQPRDADRPVDPRDAGRADHGGLVHPGLRHQRGDPARVRRPLAGAADPDLVRRLPGDAAHLRAAHARPLEGRCRRRARC